MANFHSSSLDLLLHHQVLSILFLVFFTIFINITYAADDTSVAPAPSPATHTNIMNVTELVDQVCNRTSNYTFCVDALYSDPRTPEADRYTLAYVSFGLAYLKASKTQDRITRLLKNSSFSSSGSRDRKNLKRCQSDYKKGINYLESALNDLNSETFFALADRANDTALVAEDCQVHYPPLNSKTLKFLCEICVVISKLFTGSS